MNNYEFIINRRSIRKFKKRDMPGKDIDIILEAANHSPLAYENYTSWKIVLIRDKKKIYEIANISSNQTWVENANILIVGVMLGDKGNKWKIVDTAIALENMVLTAEALNYGSCWVGALKQNKIKELLEIPKEYYVLAYIALGYKAERPGKRKYKKLNEIVFKKKFGNVNY